MSLVPSGVMGRAPLTGQALAQQRGKQQAGNRMGMTFIISSSYCTFMHFVLTLRLREVCFNYTGGKCFRADCKFLHLGPGPRCAQLLHHPKGAVLTPHQAR